MDEIPVNDVERDLEILTGAEEILKYFKFRHLKTAMAQDVSHHFAVMAKRVMQLPRCGERSIALRKLLEAKDAAVRASLEPDLAAASLGR